MKTTDEQEMEKALSLFKVFAAKLYGYDVALWMEENWQYIEP
jgi:hypothetical protein